MWNPRAAYAPAVRRHCVNGGERDCVTGQQTKDHWSSGIYGISAGGNDGALVCRQPPGNRGDLPPSSCLAGWWLLRVSDIFHGICGRYHLRPKFVVAFLPATSAAYSQYTASFPDRRASVAMDLSLDSMGISRCLLAPLVCRSLVCAPGGTDSMGRRARWRRSRRHIGVGNTDAKSEGTQVRVEGWFSCGHLTPLQPPRLRWRSGGRLKPAG